MRLRCPRRPLASLVLVGAGACAPAVIQPSDSPVAPETGLAPAALDGTSEPTVANLHAIVASGACTKLERMPLVLAQLHDPEFRLQLGDVASEGTSSPAEALTQWLVLAHQYQQICDLHGDETTEARSYVTESVPLKEATVDAALAARRCAFLLSVDDLKVWPYEVRMGREILGRQFEDAEITRRLWIDVLDELGTSCGADLDRRGRIRLEAQRERLDRIVGLDDPTLIDLRTKMLEALEGGEQEKVLAYARAVSDREKALDSRRAAEYDAKLAEIERKVAEQGQQLQSGEAVTASRVVDASGNAADTATNVANTAKAAATTVNVLRSLF
jgi:hypothetical protein